MSTFTVRRDVAAPAPVVWSTLVHWPNHGRWVPLTRVWVTTASAQGVGAGFVGRTGVGRLAFDDPMTVTAWRPPTDAEPGLCEIHKTGRVVLGDAWFTVTPTSPEGCEVTWSETVEVAGVRRLPLSGPVSAFAGGLAFGYVLRRLAAEAESR